MRIPFLTSEDEKEREKEETSRVQRRLHEVVQDLHRALDEAEAKIEEEIQSG